MIRATIVKPNFPTDIDILKLLQRLPNLDVTLIDLSRPMLDRVVQRISAVSSGKMTALQGDIREVALEPESFDIIMAAAVFHHLRSVP